MQTRREFAATHRLFFMDLYRVLREKLEAGDKIEWNATSDSCQPTMKQPTAKLSQSTSGKEVKTWQEILSEVLIHRKPKVEGVRGIFTKICVNSISTLNTR